MGTSARLLAIARCADVPIALVDRSHACHAVVTAQATTEIADMHVPEPWSGSLASAPLLFVSSNPSYDPHEAFPTRGADDEEIVSFFERRFDDHVVDGATPRRVSGTGHKKAVSYLVQVRAMARDIFGRQVTPGVDFALTEVVHCKSRGNRGVAKARPACVSRHLDHVLAASGARVVVVLGKDAGKAVRAHLGIEEAARVERDGRQYLFVGAPGSSTPRKFAKCFPDAAEQAHIRTALGAPVVSSVGVRP